MKEEEERKREKETERETERDRERQRETERDRERQRERQRLRQREKRTLESIHLISRICNRAKQWPLAGEFVEFEYSPKIRQIFVTRSGEFGEY